ncbi:MAG: amino acid adenylation domain-containing protein [Rubellimicrobium sp.]|nr:amino acid adenylation domain-containing protein [Rubellimicrobium sp.]
MSAFDAILIGHDTLTREAGRLMIEAGHRVRAVVTRAEGVREWALAEGLPVIAPGPGLAALLPDADWLLSVGNLDILAPEVLARAARGAVNFHDGPLPRRAGLNVPVWAILAGDADYAITWHLIEGGLDEGPVLVQRHFEIAADETALTLNGKCFAAALESFPEVLAALAEGRRGRPQDLGLRHLHRRNDRPPHAGRIDPAAPVAGIVRLVRALDHGDYPNPVGTARLVTGAGWFTATRAEPAAGDGAAGVVLDADAAGLVMMAGDGAVRLSGLRDVAGRSVPADRMARPGEVIARPDGTEDATLALALKDEGHWRAALAAQVPAAVPLPGGVKGDAPLTASFDLALDADAALARFAAMIAEGDERGPVDFALARGRGGLLSDRVPVRFDDEPGFPAALAAARARQPFPGDLVLRLGMAHETLPVALSDDPEAGLLPGTALTFAAREGRARLVACPDRITPAAFALIAARLKDRLAGGSGLSPEDRALIDAANATGVAVVPAVIDTLIAAQAARMADATALICEDRSLTHAQVQQAANRIANRLIAAGVRRGASVGLFLHRSEMLPVAALAIWKAGAAYLPLDPSYPPDRLAHYLGDSGAELILTSGDLAPLLPDHKARVLLVEDAGDDATAPAPRATPADAAYVIYTSGSTGTPKGVVVEHRQVANFFAGMDARIPRDGDATWLAVTSLSFDISVLELFWTLARGIRVVIAGENDRAMVARAAADGAPADDDFSLAALIRRHGVTHLQCTPSMAHMLATNEVSRAALASLRHLLIGGEALAGSLVADLQRASPAQITNLYGPTETTIWSSTGPAQAEAAVSPVGTPIANTQFHILDAGMQAVVPGVAGELWIGGAGVARGYLGRDDLTARAFVADPARGRIYRTGDLARWRADGSVDFLGRIDGQVKLRGHRIETGEIEAALTACDGVRQAVAVLRDSALVAYVTGAGAEAALKAQLGRSLPAYMVPARIVTLDALPLTPNGKIDRKALPAPVTARPAAAPLAAGDAGGVQRRIAEVWAQLLGVSGIAARDSFFDLGGNSLLAVQVHRDLRQAVGVAGLSITDIYRFPTLAALAARIEALIAPAPAAPVVPEPGADSRADAMARRRALRARRGA